MQNKWPILKGILALQLCFVALLLYTVLLPFQPFFPPITSGIVAFWLVYVLSFKKERLALIPKNRFALLWVFYFALLLLGLIYTNNPGGAEKDLILKITLILWPLGFASWPEPILNRKSAILTVFAWTTVASAIAVSFIGISRWMESGTAPNQLFLFMNVWESIPNHYIALYASFSLFIFIDLFLKKELQLRWAFLGGIVLIFFIALTGVRIQFLAIPFAAIVFLLFLRVNLQLKKNLFLYSGLCFLLLALVAVAMPSSRERLLETVDELRSINGMVNDKQTNHRVFLWKFGTHVIEDNFWIGAGTAGADDALSVEMQNCDAEFWNGKRLYKLNTVPFNFHNAFLQHFATHGIFGFLILVALFILPFILNRTTMSGLEAAFLVLCFIAFLTESMLERQAGVLFFGFFYALFFVPKSSINGK